MGRLLLFLLLIVLAAVVWRALSRALAPPREGAPKFEPTARCAKCGTHVPRDQLDASGTCARCRAAPA